MVRSLIRLSLTLAATAYLTGAVARADTAAEKAGNTMEARGAAEEKAGDVKKSKGAKMEKSGKAEEKAGKKNGDKAEEMAGEKKKKKGHASKRPAKPWATRPSK